ncbi:MAG: nitroreductase family protein [Ruminiclostridium sp.]|nr:nitroreductase family protein [Ruminiclostridium sp.]
MNEVIQNILTRRSVRGFTDQPISREDLELIIKAGLYAPSARNFQTWKFTALTKREDIDALAKAIEKVLDRSGYDMYRPAAVIIPSNESDSPYGKEDNACALENIFLAAHSMGIGSVWINQLQGICDKPEIRELLKKWGIPDNHAVYGIAAIGYPAEGAVREPYKTGEFKII